MQAQAQRPQRALQNLLACFWKYKIVLQAILWQRCF